MVRRAAVLATAVCFLLVGVLALASLLRASPGDSRVVISVPGLGELAGDEAAPGVAYFRGVKYGVADRWRSAEFTAPWIGKRDATRFGANCAQGPPESFPYPANETFGAEDCLYLNVATPLRATARGARKLPVLFWIHGGSLVEHNSSLLGYRVAPEVAAKKHRQ